MAGTENRVFHFEKSPEQVYTTCLEKWHRYYHSTLFCKGKNVLDIACGEGYGSYLLSKFAKKVTGIDESSSKVKQASYSFSANNLTYMTGSPTEIPIKGNNIFDVIVSFNTLEYLHKSEQQIYLNEIKRLLKSNGILIISVSNKLNTNEQIKLKNPLLKKYFKGIHILGQNLYTSSYIRHQPCIDEKMVEFNINFNKKETIQTETSTQYAHFIALCSNKKIKEKNSSFLNDTEGKVLNALKAQILTLTPQYFTQLYIDIGYGYTEKQCKMKELSGEEEELEFNIDEYKRIKEVKFEPLNDYIRLWLKEITVVDRRGKRHKIEKFQTNGFCESDCFYWFESNEPAIYLDLSHIFEPQKLIIQLRYTLIGDEAKTYIVSKKNQEIQQKSDELILKNETLIKRDLIIKSLNNKIYQLEPHYVAQLFFDTGKGFSEKQSIIKEVSGKEGELEFDVNGYEGIIGLRFDPLNDCVRLKLKDTLIIDDENKIHQIFANADNCTYKKDNIYTFGTHDPAFFFPVKLMNNARKIILQVQYILMGNEVNSYISKLQQDELEKNKIEIRQKGLELNQKDSEINLLKNDIQQKSKEIKELTIKQKSLEKQVDQINQHLLSIKELNQKKDITIKKLENNAHQLVNQINRLQNTWSWKITKPLRKTLSIIHHKEMQNQILKPVLNEIKSLETPDGLNISCDNIEVIFDGLIIIGWALSAIGIEGIEIFIDNEAAGSARYGFPRPDVEKSFPNINDSKNSGFLFYTILDNRQLSKQCFNLKIVAVNANGERKEIMETIANIDHQYNEYLNKTLPNQNDILWMMNAANISPKKVNFSIAILVNKKNQGKISETIQSVMNQVYPNFRIIVFYEKDMSESFLKSRNLSLDKIEIYPIHQLHVILSQCVSDFLCFIQSGVILFANALLEITKNINIDETVEIIYADEEKIVTDRRRIPFFKPDWSPELLLSMNYIGHFFVLKKDLLTSVGINRDLSSPGLIHDLLIRTSEISDNIFHIPKILFSNTNDIEIDKEETEMVLKDTLIRRKIDGEILFLDYNHSFRVRRKIANYPKISIIIPTAKKPEMNIKPCLTSIVKKSSYKNYEIILIDNSLGEISYHEIKKILPHDIPLKIMKYKKEFNFSVINNLATQKADGQYFIFLNDDTEVISPDWIEAMLEHAQAPNVGAVGAKLLYQNNTLQHAGMFLMDHGGGGGHWFRYCTNKNFGFHGLLNSVRPCSAVTFACVMVPKEVFITLNGLDENLKIECNDIDFCLRAVKAGYRIIWTPFAVLYHKESITRKSLSSSEEIKNPDNYKFFQNRWQDVLKKGDPFYNPNLSLDSEIYTLNHRTALLESPRK